MDLHASTIPEMIMHLTCGGSIFTWHGINGNTARNLQPSPSLTKVSSCVGTFRSMQIRCKIISGAPWVAGCLPNHWWPLSHWGKHPSGRSYIYQIHNLHAMFSPYATDPSLVRVVLPLLRQWPFSYTAQHQNLRPRQW